MTTIELINSAFERFIKEFFIDHEKFYYKEDENSAFEEFFEYSTNRSDEIVNGNFFQFLESEGLINTINCYLFVELKNYTTKFSMSNYGEDFFDCSTVEKVINNYAYCFLRDMGEVEVKVFQLF